MFTEDEQTQWESELMLKDKRWSVSKGAKGESNADKNQLTPLIIRHNHNYKTAGNPPPLNISDDVLSDSEEDSIGNTRIPDEIEPVTQGTSKQYLKNYITIECVKMNENIYTTR